ncbi:ATP-binding cassette domain-containing protein [Spongiactinospora sp. TRM90649]|uniref:ABC transporter ATP-binding protein n=1 Tax=Spongiactinospora sp. TRM90649 TaxID=3031114 RepID=UPI0023F7A557|nr:ATP-binding cassette domain-containing protein [Spongiactinospora sp. TRM90649]MDF5756528.1 ATP-binding cassette domain-containing protein [Spongiactinospora sp. TRM90649]
MIEVAGLTKHFGKTKAVNGLSFQVRPGLVTGFLGPNGAGKTTTMRLILGLDRPTSGTAIVNGVPYAGLRAPLTQVGSMLDARGVHGGRTAYAHLLSLAQSNGISRTRIDQVLEMTGLATVARKRVKGFSLGMSQRLGIAAALLGDPRVLMFDEPINGLDPEGIRWVRTLLKGFAAEGRTVLLSSHIMSEMEGLADHLIVIGRGELVADTTTGDLIAHSSQGYTRVRTPELARLRELLVAEGAQVAEGDDELRVTGMEIERIAGVASRAGVPVYELAPMRASLETAFMELTAVDVEFRAGQDGTRTAENREVSR